MKAVLPFFLGLSLGACTRPLPPAPTPTQSHIPMARDLSAKTVALVAETRDGDTRAYCSGVWVTGDTILTAFHCVDESEVGDPVDYAVRDDIYKPGSSELKPVVVSRAAKILALDPPHDLALIRVKIAPEHPIAALADGPVLQGAFAQTMGHSLGLWWTYSTGEVSAVRQLDINGMDLIWVQSSAPISPGNSGGGLFDEDGALLGIAHGAFTGRAQLLNVYVHRDYIRDLLTRDR
jgi:hypothetical protein